MLYIIWVCGHNNVTHVTYTLSTALLIFIAMYGAVVAIGQQGS